MTTSAEKYRTKLVQMVRASGDYISINAEDLVDHAEMMTDTVITITFEQGEFPEITVTQSHAMRNVNEVMFG